MLLTVKRTDGLGFCGLLAVNSHSGYTPEIHRVDGLKSGYQFYDVQQGKLVTLCREADGSNYVYIMEPSYATISALCFLAGTDKDNVKSATVDSISGTVLDQW